MAANPFRISGAPLLSWLFGLRTYQRFVYERVQALPLNSPFEVRALTALGVDLQCSDDDLALVPSTGAVVIAGNHPHGLLDGLALAAAVRRVRPDVRILTNHLLSRIPELADVCFFVDPFGGPRAHARSLAGLRARHLWLRRGGALDRVSFRRGRAPPSAPMAGAWTRHGFRPQDRLAVASAATIVPAFIERRELSSVLRRRQDPRVAPDAAPAARTAATNDIQPSRFALGASMPSNTATSVMREAVEHLANPRDPIATEVSQLPAGACLSRARLSRCSSPARARFRTCFAKSAG
jgi:hypothetical protein